MSVSQVERNDRERLRSGSRMESGVVSLSIAGALAGVRGLRNRELQVPAGRAAPALVSAGVAEVRFPGVWDPGCGGSASLPSG